MASGDEWQKWGIPLIIVLGSLGLVFALLLLFRWYVIRPMYKGKGRIDGKTVVITGANTGIGKETALDLAKRGGKIILLCRNMEKGQEAADSISKEANVSVELHRLDLSSLVSIRACAELLKEKYPRIDILINNAGVLVQSRTETKDGFEMTLGTNHLGHFLLTLLLIDNIKAASPARIISVSSMGYMAGTIQWDDMHMENKYEMTKSYCNSKLANNLFIRSLGEKLHGTGVTTYSLHPGAVRTDIAKNMYGWKRGIINILMVLFYKSPIQGAQTTIYCAVEPTIDRDTGKYYSGCAPKALKSKAQNDEVASKLWNWSLEQVGLPENFSI